MARSVTVTFGSGLLPHIGDYHPITSGLFQAGTYPQATVPDSTLIRLGNISPIAVLNPEDWSAHFEFKVSQVTVSSSPVELTPSPLENRRAIAIQNLGTGDLYLGHDSSVSTANGYPLEPNSNKEIAFDIKGTVKIFVVSDGTSDVRIIEIS